MYFHLGKNYEKLSSGKTQIKNVEENFSKKIKKKRKTAETKNTNLY